LEAWKLGSLEAWKLYTLPMRRRQAHSQGIMSLRGVFMDWRFGGHEVVKKGRGPAEGKKNGGKVLVVCGLAAGCSRVLLGEWYNAA
jgi:hypothetical protein